MNSARVCNFPVITTSLLTKKEEEEEEEEGGEAEEEEEEEEEGEGEGGEEEEEEGEGEGIVHCDCDSMASPQIPSAKVVSLFIYPIKSCRGISVSEAPLASTGFRWDRLWMVLNSSNGKAYTQRALPKLALVQVELPVEAFSDDWKPNNSSFLVVKAPGMDVLKVPLTAPSEVTDGVTVFEWSGSALDEGSEAAEWFSNYLGKPCRLVRFNEESANRPINNDQVHSYKIKFNDAYPFLLLSQGSMDALNCHLKEPVSLNRFRPNIFVDGCEPFLEDFWKEVTVNDLTLYAGELCWRCKIPTIDQDTAKPGREPNETLKKFRVDEVLLPKHKPQGRIYFGQTFVCKESLTNELKVKRIRVGDPVYALKVASSYDDVAANCEMQTIALE